MVCWGLQRQACSLVHLSSYTSFLVGRHPCSAALIPVLAGYNQTARQCVRQGLSGDAAEEVGRAA